MNEIVHITESRFDSVQGSSYTAYCGRDTIGSRNMKVVPLLSIASMLRPGERVCEMCLQVIEKEIVAIRERRVER